MVQLEPKGNLDLDVKPKAAVVHVNPDPDVKAEKAAAVHANRNRNLALVPRNEKAKAVEAAEERSVAPNREASQAEEDALLENPYVLRPTVGRSHDVPRGDLKVRAEAESPDLEKERARAKVGADPAGKSAAPEVNQQEAEVVKDEGASLGHLVVVVVVVALVAQ